MRDLLEAFPRCGAPTLATQQAKVCGCGASPPCFVQLKDVAERLEAANAACHRRLCMVGNLPNSAALDDAVRRVLGYAVKTDAAVTIPGATNKRSPLFGFRRPDASSPGAQVPRRRHSLSATRLHTGCRWPSCPLAVPLPSRRAPSAVASARATVPRRARRHSRTARA